MKSYNGDYTKKGRSGKKALRKKPTQYKDKTVSSYYARVVMIGPRHDRQFLHRTQGHSHLKRNKSKQAKLRAKKLKPFEKCDMYRIKRSLPYWKKSRKMRRYYEEDLRL